MGVLRELGGWALLTALVVTPFSWLVALAALLDDGAIPLWYGTLTLLLTVFAPAAALHGWRLLRADPRVEAEADGRRPVVLLHGFTSAYTPLYARVYPGAAFFADLRDRFYEHTIVRGLLPAGPVIPVPRPRPPKEHGPVASLRDPAWEARLDREIRRARIVAIVVDGTDANVREVERAFALRSPDRVLLILPPKTDAAFFERYESLRARIAIPGAGDDHEGVGKLPDVDPTTVGIRFKRDGAPLVQSSTYATVAARQLILRQPSLMLFDHESTPIPKPPLSSWVFTLLPIPLTFVGAVITPFLLEAHDVRFSSSDPAVWGLLVLFLGFVLAAIGRRAVALVPRSEAIMVLVASAPWWMSLLASDGTHDLRDTAVAAAYATPLLIATALTLASAVLIRHAPGREVTYALFGFAAMIPFATLAASVSGTASSIIALELLVVVGGFTLGLIAIAASGDAGRAHAPLPLAAASAAALGIASWQYALSANEWRDALTRSEYTNGAVHVASTLSPLETFSAAWPWFAVAIPALVVVIALPFRGRANRSSALGVLSLLPLLLVVGLATGAQASARDEVRTRIDAASGQVFEAVARGPVSRGFEPVPLNGTLSPGPVHWVIDEGGVIADERRVASATAILSASGWGGPGLSREVGEHLRERGGHTALRVTADARTDATLVTGALLASFGQGIQSAELVGSQPNGGGPVAVRFTRERLDPTTTRVIVGPSRVVVQNPWRGGAPSVIERPPGAPLGVQNIANLAYPPNRGDGRQTHVNLVVEPGVSTGDLAALGQRLNASGLDVGLAR